MNAGRASNIFNKVVPSLQMTSFVSTDLLQLDEIDKIVASCGQMRNSQVDQFS